MGMFDSVYVNCPECGQRVEMQSKAGDCMLHEYELYDAPAILQADLAYYSPWWCQHCGHGITIKVQTMAIAI